MSYLKAKEVYSQHDAIQGINWFSTLSLDTLQWRHNDRDCISNHWRLDYLLNHLCLGTDQRKHQSSASLAFVRAIHQWPVNSLHKGPIMWKMFPLDDVIMTMASADLSQWHKEAGLSFFIKMQFYQCKIDVMKMKYLYHQFVFMMGIHPPGKAIILAQASMNMTVNKTDI